MSKNNCLACFLILLGAVTLSGCGSSTETTIIEEDPTVTAETEAAYEAEIADTSNDQDQN